MRSRLIIILLLLISSILSFGQITITGKVLSQIDSTELPGVSILEIGTSNSVLSDFNGDYKITVSDTAKFLEFRCIGVVERKIPINEQTVINTSLKPYTIYEAFDQKIGFYLQSGVFNTPFGMRLYYSTPIIEPFAIGVQVDYLTNLKSNTRIDANLTFSRYRIRLGSHTWLYGDVEFTYRQLNIRNNTDLVSYSLENYARIYSHNVILGLGKILSRPENGDENSGHGIIAGYEREFRKLNYLTFTYKMSFYKETIDYHLQIEAPLKRIKTFIVFNKINNYHEIMVGIGFKTYYFYRYQNNANKYPEEL